MKSLSIPSLFPRRLFAALLLFCLAYEFAPEPARAQQFDYGSVRLLQTGERSGALFFELNNLWKISWRKNTINVFPTELRWRANASSFLWPFPNIFKIFDVRSYGYEGRTALPFTTREPIVSGEPVEVRFAACAQVCLPIETTLTAERPTPQEQLFIAAALEQVPQKETETQTGLQLTYLPVDSAPNSYLEQGQAEGAENEQSVLLQGRFSSEQKLQNPRLIVERAAAEQGGLFEVTSLKGSRNLRFKAEGQLPRDAQQSAVRITLIADNLPPLSMLATPELAPSPYAVSASTSSAQSSSALLPSASSMLGLLLLAFLGGLVLNAMPCVFPVLAVKIASFARADSQDRDAKDRDESQQRKTANKTSSSLPSSRLQRALLANALGMMLAFLLLAGVLVLAKSGGEKLGWGFQFHWPVFSGSLAALLLLLACDGWRIATLPFPAYREKISEKNLSQKEEKTTRLKEWSSECATGVLLTWLATPCAAPILGSALSAAIVQQPPVLFLMFAVMGAGMASPLLLAAVFPRKVAKILPPPGAWSEILRKVLATAIFVASLWLFSIFAKQLSLSAAGILAIATLLVVLVLRRRQQTQTLSSNPGSNPGQARLLPTHPLARPLARFLARPLARFLVRPLVLPLILASPILVAVLLNLLPREGVLRQATPSSSFGEQDSRWQAFAPERIPELLASEQIVIVNVTADWCLSCKVLEQRVYKTAAVRERLEQSRRLVLMRADWTSADARISAFMREHKKNAIPLTALFAPAGEVLLLPELYGQQTFLDALAYTETLRARKPHDQASKP